MCSRAGFREFTLCQNKERISYYRSTYGYLDCVEVGNNQVRACLWFWGTPVDNKLDGPSR